MKYKKYSDVENSNRIKFMDKIYEQGKAGGQWLVMEKIHGANFSIRYDGKNYYCGKRSGWVEGSDKSFFNYSKVLEDHKERIENLYNYLKNILNIEFDYMTLYGELFGGSYPHPEVKKVANAIRVQAGIHYSPKNELYVFDIALDDEIINYDVATEALDEFGFLYAEPLFTGTLEECLEYRNEFQTLIPEKLGLPSIKNNNCEGVVIKPVDARFMGHSRVILKNKNDKWKETKNKKRKVRVEFKFSDIGQELLDTIMMYITENRLRNVLSKEGQISQKQFGYVMKLFTSDILKDFLKDHEQVFNLLDEKEIKVIQKCMSTEASNVLRENFVNIIDGTF